MTPRLHAYRGSARDSHITRQRLLEVPRERAAVVHFHRRFGVLVGVHPEAERNLDTLLLEGNVDGRSELDVSEGLRGDGSRENRREAVQTSGENDILVSVGDDGIDASDGGFLITSDAQSGDDVAELGGRIRTSVRNE